MPKFKKGQSGNPEGRKPGSGYAAKLRAAIEDDLPDIIASVVKQAKDGDVGAARLLLDRVVPALKPVQQAAYIDDLEGKSLSEQGELIVTAMGCGFLTSEQAQGMLAGLASLSRIKEIDDIEQRLKALEDQQQ